MQSSSRAPVLSATRTRDSCWITVSPLLRHLEDLGQAPALRLREGACLDDADDVARLRLVLLVVGVELLRAADHLLVLRVRLDRVDPDDDRLVHRRRDDDAAAVLVSATLRIRLREPGDGLPLARRLPLGPGVLVSLTTRKPLALRLGASHSLWTRLLGRSLVRRRFRSVPGLGDWLLARRLCGDGS